MADSREAQALLSLDDGGVTVVPFERMDLADKVRVHRAAALVRAVGEVRGVLVQQGGYRNAVVRTPRGSRAVALYLK